MGGAIAATSEHATAEQVSGSIANRTREFKEVHRHPGEVEDEVDGIQDEGPSLLSKATLCPDHEGSQAEEHVQERPVPTTCISTRTGKKGSAIVTGKAGLLSQDRGMCAHHVGPKTGVGRFHEGFFRVLYL